jgi:SAM-dependent methyltransferase
MPEITTPVGTPGPATQDGGVPVGVLDSAVRPTYVFDDAWTEEEHRLRSLEAALDPGTIRLLTYLGVGPGWSCLEAGAGGGSIAAWLCERVGAGGHVVACDTQTTLLERLDAPNLEVRCQDITCDPLPVGCFDLVHTRWTLHWPPARLVGLAALVSAVRPGGTLLVEEPDFVTVYHGCADRVVADVVTRALRLLEEISGGMDSEYGRRLAGDLETLGLVDIETEARGHRIEGGSPQSGATWLRLSVAKVGEPLVDSGAVSPGELEEALARLADPSFAMLSPLTVACWGRRAG